MEKNEILKAEEEHKAFHRRLVHIIIVILLFLFGGATFYHFVERMRYIDALYLSAATMTTVGYGDITPQTDAGKLFTIFYVFGGVGIALYGLSVIATHFVEAREVFWLERFGKLRIRHHTQTLWDKLRNIFSYNPEELVREEKAGKRKNRGL